MTDAEARKIPGAISRLRRQRRPDWPAEFEELARYNGRKARGITHTPEYMARMAGIQARYDAWIASKDEPG